ncbi:uncharacterized protein TNCV_3033521 [Trichonephila clavipes]|nr:uncharacterized protein TNCV_3033521 [Trichonephila clavipes]
MSCSFCLRIEEISYMQRSIQDEEHQELGKEGAVPSCQDIKKRLLTNFNRVFCVIWNKLWPDLKGEKDFDDDHREEITDFVQSIPRFQDCDEEDVETWMACDAEDWISNAK